MTIQSDAAPPTRALPPPESYGAAPFPTNDVLAAVLCSVRDAIIVFDDARAIHVVNAAAVDMFDQPAADLIGSSLDTILTTVTDATDEPIIDLTISMDDRVGAYREVMIDRSDGRPLTVELSVSEVDLEGHRLFVGVGRDISQRKQSEDLLRQRASTDPLTGLVNRASLHRGLASAARRADNGSQLALLFLDLDGFKAVNDLSGHEVGDNALVAVSRRLLNAVRRQDLVARYGGDEFVIVIEAESGIERDVASIRERVTEAFVKPFVVAEHVHRLGVSIGHSIYPDDANTISQLIQRADAAMYEQKAGRRRDRTH